MQEQNRRRVLRPRFPIKDGQAPNLHQSITCRLHKTPHRPAQYKRSKKSRCKTPLLSAYEATSCCRSTASRESRSNLPSRGLTSDTPRLALLRADETIHHKILAPYPLLRNLCRSPRRRHRRRKASAMHLESILRCAETFG